MLQQLQRNLIPLDRAAATSEASANTIDLDSVLAAGRRQFKVVAGATVAVMLLAVTYIITAVPMYTSAADIMIDSRQFGAVDIGRDRADLTFNAAAIDSQVEVLKSEKIALAVIAKLKLIEDTEFISEGIIGSLLAIVVDLLQFESVSTGDEIEDGQSRLQRRAVERFHKLMQVKRKEKTFVLNVEFSSRSAVKAAVIANAISDAYLRDHLDAKYDATRRASEWLQERIEELRQRSFEADMVVAKFKEENKLVGVRGSLVNEQQLAELNSQLTTARAETGRTQARYELVQSIIRSRRVDAAVADELNNPVMTDLRIKYLKVSKRANELMTRVGPNHEQVVLLHSEMRQYEKQLFEELGRIAETYRSDMHIASSREQALAENLSSLMGVNAGDNVALVSLREKEREAESIRVLYQNFLQRYQEAVQQQSFPMTEARVITAATRSLAPSKPRKLLVLVIGLVGGLCVGTGLGMLREYRDRGFRTPGQVREETGLEFLGIVPLVSSDELAGRIESDLMRVSVASPLSKLADTLRSVKVAIDFSPPAGSSNIVGVVSAVAGEGKSTISANLAMLLGSTGSPTLLIDGDLRQSGLTRAIGFETGRGLADAIISGEPLSSFVRRLPERYVWFLPCSASGMTPNSSEVLGSEKMRDFLNAVGDRFKYIIIDLPPIGALVDAKAIAPHLSRLLFVIEWGKTPRSIAREALAHNELVRENCVGAVLNKADPRLLRLYDAYGAQSYGYNRY